MSFIKGIFHFIGQVFSFINNNFKTLLFLLILFLIFGNTFKEGDFEKANLATIEIHGPIMDPSHILKEIQEAKKDKAIKGVLLHVNSPGGALAPSVELSYAIKELTKLKPVVAYAAGTMASGSYYASIWSEKIYANPGSFIGSIGVIFNSYNIQELTDKIGIKEQVIKAGTYKQAGTFMREWTPEERESLETLINDAYNLFVNDVSEARKLDIAQSETYANARVFLAKNAKKVGLIDAVGTLQNAQDHLIKVSGVTTPRWKEKDAFDSALEKITSKSTKTFIEMVRPYGLQAY